LSARALDVFVGVASIPSRETWLQTVVQRLLPQARHIGVYLNGYVEVPDFLNNDRVTVARSQEHGDIRDNGKFFFLDQSESRYYATVDDDILYPPDYLERLAGFLRNAEQVAAVGVHGAIYPHPIIDMFSSRYLVHFEDSLSHVTPVHLLGTGTTMIDQVEWGLQFTEFGKPGMADVWFAAAAAKRNAGLFVTRRSRRWLEKIDKATTVSGGALFFEGLLDDREQVAILEKAVASATGLEGLVRSLLASPRYTEDFGLLHAVHIDKIRKRVGYAPLEDATSDIGGLLESRHSSWPEVHGLTRSETEAYGRLIIEVLADRVSADGATTVLELLDRLRDMSASDRRRWLTLPLALRFDSQDDHAEQVRVALVERGIRRSAEDAQRLWSVFERREEIPLSIALQAEAASVQTRFERLPAFVELARQNPESAASQLYECLEVNGWGRGPDVAALRQAFGGAFESFEVQMLVCMASARSGNHDLAERTLGNLQRRWPCDLDVRLMAASLQGMKASTAGHAILPVLEVLDSVLESQGVAPYRDLFGNDAESGHWIHLFEAADRSRPNSAGFEPAVSVVLTTYNDAGTVGQAMRSVLASTGVDLQLVVVDDASTDDTLKVVESIVDPRITVVHNDVNFGPYLSRNRGLEYATGEYVAIADADDWSHPERLPYQVSIMEASPHVLACKVAHVRIRPNGHIDLENHLRFVGDGPMTLMFRRWVLDHIGGFDHVRTRGDIEFLRRLAARFGPEALSSSGIPLLLATSTRSSNSKRFSEESLNLYRRAARQWHEQKALSDRLYVPLRGSRAPFIAPHDLLVQPAPAERS
jgi:hypothetical protein